jgi:hypothetical protein
VIEREAYTLERLAPVEGGRPDGALTKPTPAKTESEPDNDAGTTTSRSLIWYGSAPPTPMRQLVRAMLPETGVAIVGGQYGFAKTFVGADLASAVMIGGDFAGMPVLRKGGVLWLAAEGEAEIEGRIRAAVAARGGNPEERQPFARQAAGVPSLTDKAALSKLNALVAEATSNLLDNFDLGLALIVVDTLSAAAGFDDENSAAETQRVMTMLANLAREANALVLLIDHHGKVAETGIRGSSAKSAAADAILACLGDRNQTTGLIGNRQMAVVKLRAGPTGRVVPFELLSNHDGSTCTVRWLPEVESQPPPKSKPWPRSLAIFKRALDEAIGNFGMTSTPRAGMPEVRAVSREKVRAEFFRIYPGETQKAKRDAFSRCAKDAVERGIMCSLNVGESMEETIFWLK